MVIHLVITDLESPNVPVRRVPCHTRNSGLACLHHFHDFPKNQWSRATLIDHGALVACSNQLRKL